MAEIGIRMLLDVYFNLFPVPIVYTNLFTIAADGNQAAEGFNLIQGVFKLLFFANQRPRPTLPISPKKKKNKKGHDKNPLENRSLAGTDGNTVKKNDAYQQMPDTVDGHIGIKFLSVPRLQARINKTARLTFFQEYPLPKNRLWKG